MNNKHKLLKQNATMIQYIINFIEQMNNEKEKVRYGKNMHQSDKKMLICHCDDLIDYFELCIEKVNKC